MKRKGIIIAGIIVIVAIGIGVKSYMDEKKFNEEMIKVVKSDEAKKVFEEGLKNLDPKALTDEGVIQSYEIDYDSIKHNPMGGIDVALIINKNPLLYADFNLDKYNGGDLKSNSLGLSGDFSRLLGRWRGTDE